MTIYNPGHRERRQGQVPVPDHIERYLNGDQLRGLRQAENFGWQLAFVRRAPFERAQAVMRSTTLEKYALLTDEGELSFNHGLSIRH